MANKDAFGSYHPVINFLYFGILLAFSMLSMQPVCLVVSVACAIVYYIMLKGAKAIKLLLLGILPVFLLTVIINPAFSHEGSTILCYLPTGNPLTLESIIYGIFAGMMMVSILLWFACFSEIVTSGPMLKRIRNAITCFSIVITWSLENAIETADSMKSRGYGSKHRTAYSIYRWEERDKGVLAFLLFCGLFLLAGGLSNNLFWRYFPTVRGVLTKPITLALELTFSLLCALPIYLDRRESKQWNSLTSKI